MTESDRAFFEGVALLDRTGAETVLEVSGADAEDYLQRMISCDLRKVTGDPESGSGRLGTLMSGKGKLIAPFVIHRMISGENRASFWIVVEECAQLALREALERLVILEDVQFSLPEVTILSVQGPGADACLFGESVGGEPLPQHFAERVRLSLGGDAHAWVVNRPRCLDGGWDFFVPAAQRDALASGIRERGAVEVDEGAVERHRVLAAIPRFGVDGTEANLPPEAGYDEAIAYDKGCYAGQEVVARIRTYGHVNRRLCQLEIDLPPGGVEAPRVGSEIRSVGEGGEEGKSLGVITSATIDPRDDRAVALGFVRYKRAQVGEILQVEGGAAATIARVIGDPATDGASKES